MEILVRSAGLDDAEAIARVELDSKVLAYRHIAGPDFLANVSLEERAERWRRVISRAPSLEECPAEVLVGVIDGRPVAYSGIGASRDEDGAGTGEVYTIYVHPSHWRTGVGGVLLTEATERLCDLGHPEVTLWVLQANERARAFYERMGWAHDGAFRPTDTVWGTYLRYRAPLEA